MGSILVAGNEEIIGAPSFNNGVGDAVLYSSTNITEPDATLTPFKFDSNTSTEVDETDQVQFGVGASPISEGFYVVGGEDTVAVNGGGAADSGLLYDFRQRGPAFAPLSGGNDLLTTTPNPLAQAGSSVAISGDTFVVGRPMYNNSGAVFIYNYDSSTQQWNRATAAAAADGHPDPRQFRLQRGPGRQLLKRRTHGGLWNSGERVRRG